MSTEQVDLSPAEAAEYMSVDDSTIRRWIKKGILPARRVPTSKRLLISRSDLDVLKRPMPALAADRSKGAKGLA